MNAHLSFAGMVACLGVLVDLQATYSLAAVRRTPGVVLAWGNTCRV